MNSKRTPKKSQPRSSAKSPKSKPQDEQNELFPVVGIGASAGGLEAFTQLLSHLPIDTGMAFVLIQHLAPHHESLLTVILSRATEMPVKQVKDGMVVEQNKVYVIPPNAKMTISQGVLKLVPRGEGRGLFMTVDAFFLSLAEERGNKAIAVVLSGGDSDGSQGLEAIKVAGGITFAQCEETAKVNSMPNTAVATGQVDFILPPQEIAEEIAKISSHPYITRRTLENSIEENPESEDAVSTIFSLLRAATGVDFTNYKQTTLRRRILRRMALYKLEQMTNYVRYLQAHPAEVTALYQDLLIGVTHFFRDPETFEALKSKVFPTIVKDKSPGSPIRIWVAGCSTGEEAYSITICLLEFLADEVIKPPIQIYATDISERAIDTARNAFYTPSQVADISPERLHRFFVQVEGGYQISKPVRELCVFARQNLISDPPFSRMDLIACRNVLIYLGNSLQKKLLPLFHYGLKATGYLILGPSETVGDFSDLFALVDKKNKIYTRKIAASRLDINPLASSYPLETLNPQPIVSKDNWGDIEIEQQADRIVLNQYAPVGVIVNDELEILQFRGQTSSYLQPAPGKASFNLLKMAKEGLGLELRTAIHLAKRQEMPVTKENLQIRENDRIRQIKIDVIPFKVAAIKASYFLVLFEDIFPSIPSLSEVDPIAPSGQKSSMSDEQQINQLTYELASTKEHLQSIIEEQQATNQDLRAANEEILSSNEELQSTNEELQTAKEEIQAANEELNTINDELHRRNIESNQISNDLENLLSNINIPILMLGGDLRIRRFTPAAKRIFNLISTDVGRPLSDINHNLAVLDLEQQILEVINTLNLKVEEIQDQEGHWYDLRIRPYRTLDNKIDGAVVVLVEIDALKLSMEQLRASRDYAQAIVETVREPLLVLNLNLEAIAANRSFYETFQVAPSQTEQRSIFDLGNRQWNNPHLRSRLEELLANDTQFQDFEVEFDFEEIGQKIMLLNARKMPQVEEVQLILLAIEDITERKQLQAQQAQLLIQEQTARSAAEAANRSKDQFLSTLSHELRNPLNYIVGWASMLRTKKLNEAKTAQALETIERGAKALNQLIEDILDISRITTGKFKLNPQVVEIAPLVRAAIAIVHLSADAKNIKIQSRLASVTEKILGDPTRLQQIIWNLLTNAIKFTPKGGKIKVTLKYVDAQAQIQVSDTGQGISSEFLPYVFDRFRQADGSKTRSNSGLGLGLSIVRHLVELHGGTVDAESPGEGQGATFTVRLPLRSNLAENPTQRDLESTTDESEVPIDDLPSIRGVRVLIVDDDTDMREFFVTALEPYGVTVTAISSVSKALSTLAASPQAYDVLLSDIGMPEEDGYALIRQVRALSVEAGGQIPAAALTAYASEEDCQKAIAQGFQMHVAKPVKPTQLVRVVADLAGRN
jgi:two-component system, chemotaxis family, CheB/CheR fusion protein